MTSDSKILSNHRDRMLEEAERDLLDTARDSAAALRRLGCVIAAGYLSEKIAAYDALKRMDPEALAKPGEVQ